MGGKASRRQDPHADTRGWQRTWREAPAGTENRTSSGAFASARNGSGAARALCPRVADCAPRTRRGLRERRAPISWWICSSGVSRREGSPGLCLLIPAVYSEDSPSREALQSSSRWRERSRASAVPLTSVSCLPDTGSQCDGDSNCLVSACIVDGDDGVWMNGVPFLGAVVCPFLKAEYVLLRSRLDSVSLAVAKYSSRHHTQRALDTRPLKSVPIISIWSPSAWSNHPSIPPSTPMSSVSVDFVRARLGALADRMTHRGNRGPAAERCGRRQRRGDSRVPQDTTPPRG